MLQVFLYTFVERNNFQGHSNASKRSSLCRFHHFNPFHQPLVLANPTLIDARQACLTRFGVAHPSPVLRVLVLNKIWI
jgi:hypothetical protein